MIDDSAEPCSKPARDASLMEKELLLDFFPTNKKFKYQCVRSFFLAILLIYILLYLAWIADLNDQKHIVFSFFVTIGLVLTMLVVMYREMAKLHIGIEVYKDRIVFPKYYFWKSTLFLKEVFSVEQIILRRNVLALVVGSMTGASIVFDKQRFEKLEDFYELQRLISNSARENETPETQSKTLYIHKSKFYNYVVQVALIAILLLPFLLLSFNASVDYFLALEVGALTKTVKEGVDIYRVFSASFLHVGFVHLFGNFIGLTFLTDSLLRLLDLSRYLVVLLLSAFAGSSASLYLSPHEYVIGASGGIFGLFGAYCVVKFTKLLPGTVSQRSNTMVFAVIFLQVLIEFFVDGIDSYSHVGGFLAGAFCMAWYLYFAKAQSIFKSTAFEKIVAVLLSGAYLWGLGTFLFKVYA